MNPSPSPACGPLGRSHWFAVKDSVPVSVPCAHVGLGALLERHLPSVQIPALTSRAAGSEGQRLRLSRLLLHFPSLAYGLPLRPTLSDCF